MNNPANPAPGDALITNQQHTTDTVTQGGSQAPIATSTPSHVPMTQVNPPVPPTPIAPPPVTVHTAPPAGSIDAQLRSLGLLDRFEAEPRVLAPAQVTPVTRWQPVYDAVFAYYEWRFQDIAEAADSSIALGPQVDDAADRVAQVLINAIVNKLIIANRTNGLAVNNLANADGPPKAFLFPSVAATILAAVGVTIPVWSGDTTFVPNLNNAVPVFNDYAGNAVANIQTFPANVNMDQTILRFCSTGHINIRACDWKIPGGKPHWLSIKTIVNQRVTVSLTQRIHPENFDPPATLLSTLIPLTNTVVAASEYIIMKYIDRRETYSLITAAYE